MPKACACGGYTGAFWCLFTSAFLAFILAATGHIIASQTSITEGEIPLWYQIDTCQNQTGTISTTPTGEVSLCEKHLSTCPTLWNMYIARAPTAVEETACPIAVAEQSEFRITLETDDGFVGGAPYTPIFVLPTGASALISFSVVDAEDGILLPTTNAELGPGTTYPWRELSLGRGTESATGVTQNPISGDCASPSQCDGSCNHKDDGTCDDGGPGASYSLCPRNSDCNDCKTCLIGYPQGELDWRVPPTSGRRLAAAEADPNARLAPTQQEEAQAPEAVGEAVLGAHAAGVMEAAAQRDDHTVPAPGTRRLLKGGSSGGSSGGFGSSGRSSSRGYSTSGRTSSYNSGYSRSSSVTSYSRSYSSYRSGGYYGGSYGSRGYYGGGRSYGYRYGYGGYGPRHSIYIVRPYGYGCYSCRQRSCSSCSNCNNRRECGHETAYTTEAAMDRYEFTESSFTMQLARWPAYLIIHNATVFTSTAGSTASAYVTFFTKYGTDYSSVSGPLLGLGYIGLIFICVICCCCQSRGNLKNEGAQGMRYDGAGVQQAAQPQTVAQPGCLLGTPGCYPTAAGYPGAACGHAQGGAVAMPMAQPMAQGCYQPQQAYPQAGGYPQAGNYPQAGGMQMATAQPMAQPMPQGYPGSAPVAQAMTPGGYPPMAMATAYPPTAPPSPPSPPSPSVPIVEKKDE